VETGYWHLFRYNPELRGVAGKSAFSLDSKAPTGDYKEFLAGENRYAALSKANPEKAEKLFDEAVDVSKARFEYLNKLITLYGND
nr:hypothetical protein [Lachnospiraceae bacterium]